jgi:hypothetical protein
MCAQTHARTCAYARSTRAPFEEKTYVRIQAAEPFVHHFVEHGKRLRVLFYRLRVRLIRPHVEFAAVAERARQQQPSVDECTHLRLLSVRNRFPRCLVCWSRPYDRAVLCGILELEASKVMVAQTHRHHRATFS